jgi:hypothetical protein
MAYNDVHVPGSDMNAYGHNDQGQNQKGSGGTWKGAVAGAVAGAAVSAALVGTLMATGVINPTPPPQTPSPPRPPRRRPPCRA